MEESESSTIITISDVLEYLFCPRFIYFMYCLDIPQHEEKRYKDIAHILKTPINTVKSNIHRGKLLIKKQLTEQYNYTIEDAI